jgi:hypothetical protein
VVALSFKWRLAALKPQPKKPATVWCLKQVGDKPCICIIDICGRGHQDIWCTFLCHPLSVMFFYLSVQVPMQKNECLQAANRDSMLGLDGKGTLEERFVFRPLGWHEGLNIDVGQRWRTGT